MVDLVLDTIEQSDFSVLRRRPNIDRMQTLAMPVVERNAAVHGFLPFRSQISMQVPSIPIPTVATRPSAGVA